MSNKFDSYVNKPSLIHNLNPSLKCIGLFFLIVLVFLPSGFFGQLILIFITLIIWFSSKLPARLMKSILKSVFFLFLMVFVVNWVTAKSPLFLVGIDQQYNIMFGSWNTVYSWLPDNFVLLPNSTDVYAFQGFLFGGTINGITEIKPADGTFVSAVYNGTTYYLPYISEWYTLSLTSILLTFNIALKIFIMISLVTILTATTSPIQLAFAIEDIFGLFKIFKMPVNEWAMTISIALRFVPSLLNESTIILNAQASRGVDFSNGNFKDKTKAMISLIVPMFTISFKKADDLANAMEARAYNPRYARTRYRNYSIKWFEWIGFTLVVFAFAFFLVVVIQKMVFAPFAIVELYVM